MMPAPEDRNARRVGPMRNAAGLYDRLINLANARNFGRADTEMLTAMMLASIMLQEPEGPPRGEAARRIVRQAQEFIDLQFVITDDDGPPNEAG